MKQQQRPPIGVVKEWLEKPDLFVTRRELWWLLEHYDKARLTEQRQSRWWRVLLRRLFTPAFTWAFKSRLKPPTTPIPSGETGK